MKKIISLLLVLVMIFALAPAAYAEESGTTNSSVGEASTYQDWYEFLFLLLNRYYYYEENEGILNDYGHLLGCSGGNCSCYATVKAAHEEYMQQKWEQSLQVWIRNSRDAEDQRHDTVVAELELPYNDKKVELNKEYLEGKEAVAKLLEDFVPAAEQAEVLYRPSEFIDNQTIGCLDYVKNNNSKLHVQYMLMSDGVNPYYGLGIGLVEDGSELGAATSYIVSREPIDEELPEYDVAINIGKLMINLPESCVDKAFSMGLSFYENGAVRVMLVDDEGKLIPGATVTTTLAEGASKAAVVNDSGKLEEIKDSAVEKGCIAFAAPTGDDVFALTK